MQDPHDLPPACVAAMLYGGVLPWWLGAADAQKPDQPR